MAHRWQLENILETLEKLDANKKPLWGEMSAQRMVEHLTDTLSIATGKKQLSLQIPEDKIERMQAFLDSDKPMARNVQVPFASPEIKLRNEDLELAIDEFVEEWLLFEDLYEENKDHRTTHPFYGNLNFEQWKKLNDKHLNHHFEQFGLI